MNEGIKVNIILKLLGITENTVIKKNESILSSYLNESLVTIVLELAMAMYNLKMKNNEFKSSELLNKTLIYVIVFTGMLYSMWDCKTIKTSHIKWMYGLSRQFIWNQII